MATRILHGVMVRRRKRLWKAWKRWRAQLFPRAAHEYYLGKAARKYEQKRRLKPMWAAEDAFMEFWLASVPVGAIVLDVPVGTGRFAPQYAARRLRLIGLDMSPDMLAIATERFVAEGVDGEVRQGDITNIGLPDKSVDHIVCFRVLNHLRARDARRALHELSRVSTGTIVVSVNLTEGRSKRSGNGRAQIYTQDQYAAMLADAGLRVKRQEPIGGGFVLQELMPEASLPDLL